MTETRKEGNEVIILNKNNPNQNPKNSGENNEIPSNQGQNTENPPQTQTQEVMVQNPAATSTSVQVNPPNLEDIQLDLNKKDIIEIPQEIKEKLKFPPCPICQSDNYTLYIPESPPQENNQNAENNQEVNPNPNSENREIASSRKYNFYFPILICQSNHQRCLMCNQAPHNDKYCEEQFLRFDYILSVYDTIKPIIPEQKNLDFIYLYNSANSKSIPQSTEPGCCNGKCCWTNSLYIFLLFLWTCASAAILGLGIGFCVLSFALRIFCCLYHFCYRACCTTTVTEEDKGNYILRTTTRHLDKERADEAEQEEHDNSLAECGANSLLLLRFIPSGYKKISEWYGDWTSS